MALQFNPPSFIQPQRYEGIANLGQTLDQIYNRYLQGRQMGQEQGLQALQLQRQAGQETLQYGFPLAQVGQPNLQGMVRDFIETRKKSQALGIQEKEAGIAEKQSEAYRNYQLGNQAAAWTPGAAGAMTPHIEKIEGQNVLVTPGQRGSRYQALPTSDFSIENTLRDEFNKHSADFIKIRDSLSRVEAAAKNPSAAGDLALIFNYMKILDPGSVVRESEFQQAAQSGSFGERIKAAVDRLATGKRLSDEIRRDFVDRAQQLYGAQERNQARLRESYAGIASRAGVNPENVLAIPGLENPLSQQPQAQAPQFGITPEQAQAILEKRKAARKSK